MTYLCQATDGELIGAVQCSCADYRTVKVLNQTPSLLLITHNATNSHVRRIPFFPPTIHKYFGSGTKKKKKNNLHTIITVGWADCLQMFVLIIMGASLSYTRCVSYNHNRAAKHAARCKARRSPSLKRISEVSKTLAARGEACSRALLWFRLDKRVVNSVAQRRGRRQRHGRKGRRGGRRRRDGGVSLWGNYNERTQGEERGRETAAVREATQTPRRRRGGGGGTVRSVTTHTTTHWNI